MAEYVNLDTHAPLTREPGPIPAEPVDEPKFHQYIIAIGAVGETPVPISMILHDTGMEFAQKNGLDPLLCVGYVTPAAFRPDYLSAAEIWHSMTKEDREGLKEWGPRLYVALSLLFGVHGERKEFVDSLEREIMQKWIGAIGGMDWYNSGITEGSQAAQFHGRALAATLDAVLHGR